MDLSRFALEAPGTLIRIEGGDQALCTGSATAELAVH